MITEQQRLARKGKIGSSDTAAALGVSPWKTRLGLYTELLGLVEPEPKTPEEQKRLDAGNRIEKFIAESYTDITGTLLKEVEDDVLHPDYDYLISHPDRIACGTIAPKVVEIKNVGPRMWRDWGEDGDPNGAPKYVVAQVVQQALMLDAWQSKFAVKAQKFEQADVIAYFGGDDFRVYPLRVSQEAKDIVLNNLVNFYESYVRPRFEPPATALDLSTIRKMYPKEITDKTVEAGEDILPKLDAFKVLKASEKEVKERLDLVKAEIIAEMGDAHYLCDDLGDTLFTYKKDKDTVKSIVEWEKVARHLWLETSEAKAGFTEDYFQGIINQHTKDIITRKGARKLLDKRKDG